MRRRRGSWLRPGLQRLRGRDQVRGFKARHPLDPSWVPLPVPRGRLNMLGARSQGLGTPSPAPQIMEDVEVKQLVRYFPQVQFLDKVDDCPLLCSLRFGPDSAQFAQLLDKVVDMPVAVQRQVYLVGQSRQLWRSRSCKALIRGRCPCCAGRRLGLVEGASDSVHRQSQWTFQFSKRRWAFSEGTAAMQGWAFFALLRVVPELSASFRSPR